MTVFTVREIEYRRKVGRMVRQLKKSEEGLQFKNECYLKASAIQTMKAMDLVKFKGVCHAAMNKEKWFVLVSYCP